MEFLVYVTFLQRTAIFLGLVITPTHTITHMRQMYCVCDRQGKVNNMIHDLEGCTLNSTVKDGSKSHTQHISQKGREKKQERKKRGK